jgi:hypothetical protein
LTTDLVVAQREFVDALGVLNGTVKPADKGIVVKPNGAIGQQSTSLIFSLGSLALAAAMYL